jgi:hypothetical protein
MILFVLVDTNIYGLLLMSFPEFFEWADARGLGDKDIARRLGYDNASVWRVRNGRLKDTTNFAIRAAFCFGNEVRPFFSDVVSVDTNSDPCIKIQGGNNA